MFYKISTPVPKSFTFRKSKAVSLKSLNLYSSDSEKNNEDKNINITNKTTKKKENINISKNILLNQNINKTGIKKKYFKLLQKNLSSNNLENAKTMSPPTFYKKGNSQGLGKYITNKEKDKKILFKLKAKNNNILKDKIKKSNSYLNIKDFSTVNSTFYLNKEKNSTLSSNRKTFYLNQNQKIKSEKKNMVSPYNRRNSRIANYSKIFLKNKNPQKKSKIKNIMYEQRKKYPFIYNSDIIKPQKFEDLPESIINYNKKFCTILNQENISLFTHSFNIVNKGKFSQKFEIPSFYFGQYHILNKKQEIENKKEIFHGKQIIRDLNKIIELNKFIDNDKSKKDLIYYKFRKKLSELLIIFRHLMIPISEIINTYKTTNHIFNYQKTKDLVFAIKTNNFELAFKILIHNKFLVLDIDQFYQTPLHYAAKYNFYKLIPLIIGYGGYVDYKNCYGETPLMICVKKNYYESIVLLFLYYASPFMNFHYGKQLSDVCKDFKTNFICQKIKDIYIQNISASPRNFYNKIKNEISNFIVNECGYIKSDCFEFIQNKITFYKFDK